jgi:hypothetical protein
MPKEEELQYRWTGTRLGNTSTCNAQGFFSMCGLITTFHYNSMLCLYYACAIAFTMQEQNIKKYVEPLLHGLPVIYGLVPSLFFLSKGLYNPQIGNSLPYTSWCTTSAYPMSCRDENEECIRGFNASTVLMISGGLTSFQSFVIIVGSLALVIRKVRKTEKLLYCSSTSNATFKDLADLIEKHINTKAVLIQALLYITAFLVGVIPPFVRVIAEQFDASEVYLLHLLQVTLFFLPLQGFFNFLIFISYKVYNYRRMNKTESIGYVLRLLFFTSAHEPYYISRISFVWKDEQEGHAHDDEIAERKLLEIMTHDEGFTEMMRYRLNIMSAVASNNIQSFEAAAAAVADDDEKVLPTAVQGSEHGLSSLGSSGLSFRSDDDDSFPSKSPLSFHSKQDDSSSGMTSSHVPHGDE